MVEMLTPQDQINALLDSLEDALAEHWGTLSRSAAVDVLQRLVDLTILHIDTLSLELRSPD